MAKATDKEKMETRQHIYDVAKALFYEQGYSSTTMRNIAKASDNSIGLSLYYFKSKENLGVEIYKVTVLKLPMVSIQTVLLFSLSCVLSFLIFVLFDFCFGMIAFFTTYIFGLLMAKEALLSFLTGQLIPISLFPLGVQKVFDYLPFSSMIYTPVMIYLGKYTGQELLFVLTRQLVWVILLYLFGNVIWKMVTKRLVVLGG